MRAFATSFALLACVGVCHGQPRDEGVPSTERRADPAPVRSSTIGFLRALDERSTLRPGARGEEVRALQRALAAAGFEVAEDGVFGPGTLEALKEFQRKNGLGADGMAGPKTWSALEGGARAPAPPAAPERPVAQPAPDEPTAQAFVARGTGYYPENSELQGGFRDRMGNRLHTLQSYLDGDAPFVSTAMDAKAFSYGQKIRILELEKKYGQVIDFRVVDTGGAFTGKGRTRIDICTANKTASRESTINGALRIVVVK